jgi:hypothetical protein
MFRWSCELLTGVFVLLNGWNERIRICICLDRKACHCCGFAIVLMIGDLLLSYTPPIFRVHAFMTQ